MQRLMKYASMKKPANFASVLFIAAALGLWSCQQSTAGERLASLLERAIASAVQ